MAQLFSLLITGFFVFFLILFHDLDEDDFAGLFLLIDEFADKLLIVEPFLVKLFLDKLLIDEPLLDEPIVE